MDQLAAMRVFVAVAEARGFAPAARRLGISQAQVTRLVAALEEHVAARLLHRTTRAVALTEAGARYLDRARSILADVAGADADARKDRTAPAGRLAVAAPSVFGRLEVAPLFDEFLGRYPDVRGELLLADRLVSIVEDDIDVAIRIGALDDSTLVARQVGATRRVLVGSPRYFAEKGRPASPDDLASHALIHFTSASPLAEWRFASRDGERRVPIRPRVVTNSADVAILHAERGRGLALVLSYQAAAALRAGSLEIVLADYEPAPSPISIVHKGGPYPRASVAAFVDWVVERRKWDFTQAGGEKEAAKGKEPRKKK